MVCQLVICPAAATDYLDAVNATDAHLSRVTKPSSVLCEFYWHNNRRSQCTRNDALLITVASGPTLCDAIYRLLPVITAADGL